MFPAVLPRNEIPISYDLSWELGPQSLPFVVEEQVNKLYQGDCVGIMETDMDVESVDLTVTSTPYDDLRTYNGTLYL